MNIDSLVFGALFTLVSSLSFAVDTMPVNVTFNASPCVIDVASKGVSVAMGTVDEVTYRNHGSGFVPFDVVIKECGAPHTVIVDFMGTTDPLLDGGGSWILKNTGGSAIGVGVSLFTNNNVRLSFNGSTAQTINLVSGDNTLTFKATMAGMGPDNDLSYLTGTVSASATFNISYN